MPAVINKKLAIHTAEHLLAVAPKGATELILATYEEATSRGVTITRRIALGWKIAGMAWLSQLQNAANGFSETASLSDSGGVREDSNGAPASIKGGDRRHGWWTVQFLPLAMIRCWGKYECALPEVETIRHDIKPKIVEMPVNVPIEIPVVRPVEIPKETVPASVPSPALPRLVPLGELHYCRKSGFLGNCAAPTSEFITDGRVLLVKSACDSKAANLPTVDVGGFGPNRPAGESNMKQLLAHTVEEAKQSAEIKGFAFGKDIEEPDYSDVAYACIRAGENIVVADAHKIRFIQASTGADCVKIAEGHKPILFLKADRPVALLSPLNSPDAVAAFKKMFTAEKLPSRPLHYFEFSI